MENDLTAEFLSRERAALGELADDFSQEPKGSPLRAASPALPTEHMQRSNAEFAAAVTARDAAEETEHQAVLEKAKDEIDLFYKQYTAHRQSNAAANSQPQTEEPSSGTLWDRVARSIDQIASSRQLKAAKPGMRVLPRFQEVIAASRNK